MQGQNDPTYSNIIKSISAIIFLSTPHRGTNLAETLNRILQVSFVTNPMQFIAELATGSQTLQQLNEHFRHVAPKLEIVSFYETRPTTMFKKTQIVKTSPPRRGRAAPSNSHVRWSLRRTPRSWDTRAKSLSPSMPTTMGCASTKAETTPATSRFETS